MILELCLRTRGRADWQPTINALFFQEVVKKIDWLKLKIVTPRSEYKDYVKHQPWTKRYISVVPDEYRSGDVFQHICEDNQRYNFCIDDDLTLARRRVLTSVSQKGANAEIKDVVALMHRVRKWLKKGYAHGGISMRQNNHYAGEEVVKYNTRVCGATFFDSKVINEEGIRFDAMQARSDFHVFVSLLELGYVNVCDYEFMVGHSRMKGMERIETNSRGGCSVYRTPEFLVSEAKLLQKYHPNVRLKYKKTKDAASEAIQTEQGVPDVTIGWKRSVGINSSNRSGKFDKTKVIHE